MSTVAVIDYGMGNLHSVSKALEKAGPGIQVTVTGEAETILRADRVVLPGVGAIRDCMGGIVRHGLDGVIREVVASGRPLLGVCMGMQVLLEHSVENGGIDGLGIIPGRVRHFRELLDHVEGGDELKIPHMGWNQVHQSIDHPLWQGIAQDARFYFVHSYYVEPAGPQDIAGSTVYGAPFCCALARGNVFAVQFHPEKSQHDGLALYGNFLRWDGRWDATSERGVA